MQILDIRQDLISQLKKLNKKKEFSSIAEFKNLNWRDLKIEIQKNLNKLKSTSRIYDILAYVLLTITGVISFLKVLDLGNMPDLNKGALLILLTVTNAVMAFSQKIRIGRLEKQFLLIDILEKIDSEDNVGQPK